MKNIDRTEGSSCQDMEQEGEEMGNYYSLHQRPLSFNRMDCSRIASRRWEHTLGEACGIT
jgi:hypothetical protein